MKNLNNKVAYITGGTKGIGLGIAKALLSTGMKVAISGRKQQNIDLALEQLGESDNVMGVVSDVSDILSETRAIEAITSQWGNIDVLIANAGVGYFSPIDTMSQEQWNEMIETNLTGAFNTLKAGVESLKRSEGYYLTIASLAGVNFFAQGAGYNATKFGLVGFTQAAMLDLRPHNIKVSCIMPGSVATHFRGNIPSSKDDWKIQAEDIGQIVVDLLRMPHRTLPSKIEVRPTRPDLK
ncbi:MAG: SDR family oxidoreductase [Flavobacteriaceae bacterium]|nr:SDR family oxidoreductase [Flavobacteriaceae bacterium]MDH3796161.1 SDR family oxidoreductase [Flavobacteriaceae bacterium]